MIFEHVQNKQISSMNDKMQTCIYFRRFSQFEVHFTSRVPGWVFLFDNELIELTQCT